MTKRKYKKYKDSNTKAISTRIPASILEGGTEVMDSFLVVFDDMWSIIFKHAPEQLHILMKNHPKKIELIKQIRENQV